MNTEIIFLKKTSRLKRVLRYITIFTSRNDRNIVIAKAQKNRVYRDDWGLSRIG